VKAARQTLAFAAIAIALGLGVSGTVSRIAGGVMLLVGWLAMIVGLHRYGRAGSET